MNRPTNPEQCMSFLSFHILLVLNKWKRLLPQVYYSQLETMVNDYTSKKISQDQFRTSIHSLVAELKQGQQTAHALLPQRKVLLQKYMDSVTNVQERSLIEQYYAIRTLQGRSLFVANNKQVIPHLHAIAKLVKDTTPIMLQHANVIVDRITIGEQARMRERPQVKEPAAKRRRLE